MLVHPVLVAEKGITKYVVLTYDEFVQLCAMATKESVNSSLPENSSDDLEHKNSAAFRYSRIAIL